MELKTSQGKTFSVKASQLLMAGPWAVSFLDRLVNIHNPNAMRMVAGSHFVVPKPYNSDEAYILQNKDGRIVFVIPYEGEPLVGTTDEDFKGNPSDAAISNEETDYLIDVVNNYFKSKITREERTTYSGVPTLRRENAQHKSLLGTIK